MKELLSSFLDYLAMTRLQGVLARSTEPQGETRSRPLPASVAGQVWHVYAAYLSIGNLNLEDVARRLVTRDLARLACLPDGTLFWLDDGQLKSGAFQEEDNLDVSRTELLFPSNFRKDLCPDAYLVARHRSTHRQIFGEDGLFPVPHVRAILPPFWLRVEAGPEVELSSSILIYQDGMTLVTFCCGTGDRQVETHSFIKDFVNLKQKGIASSVVSPAVAARMMEAFSSENASNLYRRLSGFFFRRLLPRALKTFDRVGENIVLPGDARSTLNEVTTQLVETMAFVLRGRRDSVANIFFGRSRLRWTGSWMGSAHVHLLAFTDQVESAASNHELHKSFIEQFLSGHISVANSAPDVKYGRLPRAFDDFGIYAVRGKMVWVYGKRDHLDAQLVHHNEMLAEPLAYGSILLRSLLNELQDPRPRWERVLDIRERWLAFEDRITTAGKFGDIRDFLQEGLRWHDANIVREEIDNWMVLRERQSDLAETRQRLALRITLAALLAVLGLPGLQREIRPLYRYILEAIGVTSPHEPSFTILVYILTASFLLLLLLTAVRIVSRLEFLGRPPVER